MTFARALINVLATTLLLALLGTGAGYALARFSPGYYRSIFRSGNDATFDPVNVGVGLGLTQGLAAGVVVGLALVALLCWRDVRRVQAETGAKTMVAPRRETSFRTLRVVGLLLLLLIVAGMAFGLGAIVAERGTYHRRYLEEKKLIAPVLAQDPAFVGIELRERSNGGVSITGRVPTREDKERLHAALLKAVGEVRAKEILYGISTPQLLEADN
jgi:hypothetical protein